MTDSHMSARGARLAVRETLLRGATPAERIAQAVQLGIGGIEFSAVGLNERVPELHALLSDAPVQASAVHLGTQLDFLSGDELTRQHALDKLRYAMTDAVDIGAEYVVMVPQGGATLDLPNLMPFKAPIELALELMVWHLRSVSDLAYVFGVKLLMQPCRPAVTGFLQRLGQGEELRRRIKFHAHVSLAADLDELSYTEPDALAAVQRYDDAVSIIYGSLETLAPAAASLAQARADWWTLTGDSAPTPATLASVVSQLAHTV